MQGKKVIKFVLAIDKRYFVWSFIIANLKIYKLTQTLNSIACERDLNIIEIARSSYESWA